MEEGRSTHHGHNSGSGVFRVMEYFCCYHSYRRKLAKLSDQEVGRLFRALLEYSETGKTQELTGRESVAFDFITDDIDRAKKNYMEKCEKLAANGRKKAIAGNCGQKQPDCIKGGEDKSENKSEDKSENKGNLSPPGGGGDTSGAAAAGFTLPPVSRAVEAFCNKINPTPSERSLAELASFEAQMGSECCLRAIDEALDARAASWNYIRKILRSKLEQGVRCIADWDRLEEKRYVQTNSGGNAGGSAKAAHEWGLDTVKL